uniref:Gustatory receptor n=1 Tax=Anopheles albimanus TaxID=7167 RepID=A0A182FRY1_ANOAL
MKVKSGNRELLGSLFRFPKTDVFDCIPLHYLVLKMSGMGCITPRSGVRNGTTMTTLLDIVLFVVHLTLAISMMIYGTLNTERHSRSSIMLIGVKLVNFTCYVSTIYGLISCFINRHEIWKFYNECHAVDKVLEALGKKTNFTQSFFVFLAYYVGAISSAFVLIIVLRREDMSWMLLINITYSYFCLITFHIVSITCLAVVLARNVRLNVAFREQFAFDGDAMQTSSLTVYSSKQIVVLRQIMQAFDQICDLADKGSFYYGVQIMVSVAGSFVFLLFYTFAFTLVVRSVIPFDSVFYAGPLLSYVLFSYNVFIIAFLGNALKQQVNRLCFVCFKFITFRGMLVQVFASFVMRVLRLFLMQLSHRSPIITCGLFPFDWTLIFSLNSTAATYIIILLQFESAGSASEVPTQ